MLFVYYADFKYCNNKVDISYQLFDNLFIHLFYQLIKLINSSQEKSVLNLVEWIRI